MSPAASPEHIASTARISLVSKPSSSLSEHRSLPALPRRTTPLPGLKSLFQNPPADTPPVVEMPSVITQPLPEPPGTPAPKAEKSEALSLDEDTGFPKVIDPLAAGDDDLAGIWQKMALLNEELAQTIQERDHAMGDINLLRDQLRLSDELIAKNRGGATGDELAQVARERDEALAELKALKEKPARNESQQIKLPDGVTKTKEIGFLTQERDQARKEYSELRKQFEGFKREQGPSGPPPLPRDDSAKVRKELEQQLDGFSPQAGGKEQGNRRAESRCRVHAAVVAALRARGEQRERRQAQSRDRRAQGAGGEGEGGRLHRAARPGAEPEGAAGNARHVA